MKIGKKIFHLSLSLSLTGKNLIPPFRDKCRTRVAYVVVMNYFHKAMRSQFFINLSFKWQKNQ